MQGTGTVVGDQRQYAGVVLEQRLMYKLPHALSESRASQRRKRCIRACGVGGVTVERDSGQMTMAASSKTDKGQPLIENAGLIAGYGSREGKLWETQKSKELQERERCHLWRLQRGPASLGKLELVFFGDSPG
jgi:hypothetical protein